MKQINKLFLCLMFLSLCLAQACSPAATQQAKLEPPVSDYFPDDDWRSSTPEEQGVDSGLILKMLQEIQDQNIDVHSFLLVRNGYLVTEAYFDPYSRDIKHPVYSATKSVISILTGIAMHEGYIEGVDQKALDFFPEIAKNVKDEWLINLTIGQLLTMSAGYNTRTIPYTEVLATKDASFDTVEYILTYNSILVEPGTVFYYDSGLPPSEATGELQATIERLANPEAQLAPLPEIAHRISGKSFQITQGPAFYFNQVTLTFEDGENLYRSVTTWPDGGYDVLGGLDNRFHVDEIIHPEELTVAVKGYWQDEKTFVEILKIFSEIGNVIHAYTFEGNRLTIDVRSSLDTDNFQMIGEMIDP